MTEVCREHKYGKFEMQWKIFIWIKKIAVHCSSYDTKLGSGYSFSPFLIHLPVKVTCEMHTKEPEQNG